MQALPSPGWLLYGATGFTGRLLARRAAALGLAPVLAGRDEARLRALGEALGLAWEAASLGDPGALARLVRERKVVLNAAGPFAATAGPLAAACLATGTHYVDVTGEPAVFVALHGRDGLARRRGVMLLPGAGFTVLASDCLAAHAARQRPGASRLRLGISLPASLAGRGSLRTVVPYLCSAGSAVQVCRGGRLVDLPWGALERDFDYGKGPRPSLASAWADLVTAPRTTGIPDVEVYLDLLPGERAALSAGRLCGRLGRGLPGAFGRALLDGVVALLPEGPTVAERRRARCVVVAEVDGVPISRLRTPDQYTFTAASALAVVREVLLGNAAPGFQTPAGAYGADFVLGLPGVAREDLV
jgi:short subunit dehydrogenase-like uncharacterized protein